MAEENGSRPFAPERYREYLRLLAGLQLPKRLRRVLSDSDMAHETILKAHKKREQFHGHASGREEGRWGSLTEPGRMQPANGYPFTILLPSRTPRADGEGHVYPERVNV